MCKGNGTTLVVAVAFQQDALAPVHHRQSKWNRIGKEQANTATELTCAEVISYSKKNLEREEDT